MRMLHLYSAMRDTFTMGKRSIGFLCLGLAIVSGIVNPLAPAQHLEHTGSNPTSPTPAPRGTVIVDGALNPELIPDDIAYFHFFKVLSKTSNVADQTSEDRRRRSYVRKFFTNGCGAEGKEDRTLTPIQVERMLAVVDQLMPSLDATNTRLTSSKTQGEYDAARRQMMELVATSAAQLPSTVDSDAATRIAAHVSDRVKKHIRIVTTHIPHK
jgi:hypothetical protein